MRANSRAKNRVSSKNGVFMVSKVILTTLSILSSVSLFSGVGLAEETEKGPHGGVLMHSAGQSVEVSVDQKRVQVYVLKRTKNFPGAIAVSLKDSEGRSRELQLKTIDPTRDPILYSTPIDGGSQSFVGFEVRIPFKKERPLVIKSK